MNILNKKIRLKKTYKTFKKVVVENEIKIPLYLHLLKKQDFLILKS